MPTIPAIPTLPAIPTTWQVPSVDKARDALTDAAYVGVGAAVITAQQVNTARKDVQELLEDGFAKLINLRPAEVRVELSERIPAVLRERFDTFADAGRKALRKPASKTSDKPAAKTSTKAATSKVAA